MPPAEFFDIFGALGFVYIVAFSIWALAGGVLPRWAFLILLLVGIVGFIVDAVIVYKNYLRK